MIRKYSSLRWTSCYLQHRDRNYLLLSFIVVCSLMLHLIYMSCADLLVEETYYWNYSQHLDFGYLDHPPMVALLIKLFTSLLGTSEFSVRSASLFCWVITLFFSYKLAEVICKHSGIYTLLLLSILPFFFFQSIIITPDSPLLSCWSAAVYFLYLALVSGKSKHWYSAGVAFGLGLLSKYSIALLSLPILVYMVSTADVRFWFKRKEPYLCALIALLLFSPVLYWNSTHHWASFVFQSVRRFKDTSATGTFELLWVTFFYLTPVGIWGASKLIKQSDRSLTYSRNSLAFVKYFSFVPWLFFFVYSLNHNVNFDWIGPIFLSLLPWLSLMIVSIVSNRELWFYTSLVLMCIYVALFITIRFNSSELIQQKLFIKVIAWDKLIFDINQLAEHTEETLGKKVVLLPLDNYPINSELAFYQDQLFKQGKIKYIYASNGAHIFNRESLMYRYWSNDQELSDKAIILISKELWRFDDLEVTSRVNDLGPLSQIESVGQGSNVKNIPYYYKIVELQTNPKQPS